MTERFAAGKTRLRVGKVTAAVDIHIIPLGNYFQKSGRKLAREVSKEIVREAKLICPVRTGKLRDSIHYNQPRKLARWTVEGRVTASAPYARFVHEGTKAHRIPRIDNTSAKVLHFYWPVVGHDVFFKSVWHPGTGKTPFLRAAANTVAARRQGRIT